MRRPTRFDRLLAETERALRVSLAPADAPARPYPAAATAHAELDETERRHAAGLMRINHAGEVCAQALYVGQATVARDARTRAMLEHAADEEADHLAWCEQRLRELSSGPSKLNPVWYAGSFALGALSGLFGDRPNLGFVVETERQVEAHLAEHEHTLPVSDDRSRAVVRQMKADEASHGEAARRAGGRELPWPVPGLMRQAARLMKVIAYRF